MNLLFYFKRLKVNMAFCILLLLSGCTDKKPLEITELEEVTEQEFYENKVIVKSPNAKVTFSDCKFYLPKKQKKLAPAGVTEIANKEIYIKVHPDIYIRYDDFLYLKNEWAKKRFIKARSMLRYLDSVDKIENYRFVEKSN